MEGMFRANGGCGYVKKPDILMTGPDNEVFSPKAKSPVKKTLKVHLKCSICILLNAHFSIISHLTK